MRSDPASTLDIRTYLMQKLNECATLNGEAFQSVILPTIDPLLITQLQQAAAATTTSTTTNPNPST